jgi:hypothetical protein
MSDTTDYLARVVERQSAQVDRLCSLIGQMHGRFADDLDAVRDSLLEVDERVSGMISREIKRAVNAATPATVTGEEPWARDVVFIVRSVMTGAVLAVYSTHEAATAAVGKGADVREVEPWVLRSDLVAPSAQVAP